MNEQERAEQHLKTIRRLMERATIYRAISAPTALVGGLLSFIACAIGWTLPAGIALDHRNNFIFLWLVVLFLTVAANTLFIVLGARKRDEPVFSKSMKAAFVALAPAFLTAAVLTFLFGETSDPSEEFTVSIMWAICYGLGLLATSHFAPRSLTLLGWAFLCSAIAAIMFLRFSNYLLLWILTVLDAHTATVFMALTFGLYHLIYAACAWPRKGAETEP